MLSVNQLSRLLERGEYKLCLEEAATLLAEGEHGPEAMARIAGAILRSQYELADYHAAARTGTEAIRLCREAEVPDLEGQALADLGGALLKLRRYEEASELFGQFREGLSEYTGARCLEGAVLERMGLALAGMGKLDDALRLLAEAGRWNEHYGDDRSGLDCARAMLKVCVEKESLEQTEPLLAQEAQYVQKHPQDQESWTNCLLDHALVDFAAGRYERSVSAAFQALEHADDRLAQQSQAHLLLCQNALAQGKPVEALSFALAARISAIDGRLYDLEFEASEITFRLLRERGRRVLWELEAELAEKNVDLFQYMPRETIDRMFRIS